MPFLIQPCALVEAMTCRIPVVATAVNSVAEAVISGSTGLLARPGDPRSLARALEYALDHPVEMDRMAAAALELVNARCRSDLLGDAFARSYELKEPISLEWADFLADLVLEGI